MLLKRTSLATAVLYATVFASPVLAPAQTATPVPDIKGNFSSMNFLLGTWTCKTTKNSLGRGTGRLETDVTTMSNEGHYMETKGVSKPFDKLRTRPFISDGWVGYDKVARVWYTFSIANFGGFGYATSPGFVGNKIVWTDKYATDGGDLGVGTTTKVSDTETTTTYVTKMPKVLESTTSVCNKSA